MNADALINEAKRRAKNTIEEAEAISKQMLAEMEDRLKSLGQHYKNLELHKENLLSDLKRLATKTIDRIDRAKAASREFDPDQHLALAMRESKKITLPKCRSGSRNETTGTPPKAAAESAQPEPVPVEASKPTMAESHENSAFFLRRNSMRGKVALEGLEFHAYHGVYPHERSSGNKFEVDIMVETEFLEAAFQDDLSGTSTTKPCMRW